ncbi:thioester domain-containing protein [Hyunsoonleella sp. 2307UL5-6]|uniref:thioester domain-containing protein n=1 Tax=Hyunsoonleella sp. 2307UL5-6 TaxID=3384768 RepID=UPI0039BCBEED
MKKNLLLLLGVAVMIFSCQNETINEESSSIVETQEQVLSTITEPDSELILNEESETLVERPILNNKSGLQFGVSSKSYSAPVGGLEALEASLPESVSIQTTANPGNDAYFDFDILDTNLAATDLAGWCVDVDLDLGVEGPLDFDVYSSYGDLPADKFEMPENFDKVNWIMNQDFIGKESATGGPFTFGHVQWAIWELIDDRNCALCTFITNPTGEWILDRDNNRAKGREIVEAALANGEGFIPSAGQKVAIILVPEGKQSIFYTVEVPAEEEECNDCQGDVDEVTLKFNWHNPTRIKFYQRYENTKWGVKIFDKVLQPGEEFTVKGVNHDGSFGKFLYIFTNHCYYTCFNTNCYINIGPGFKRGVFEVIEGTSTEGGELCEYTW